MINFWDLSSRKLKAFISQSDKTGMCMALKQIDENLLAAIFEDGCLYVWKVEFSKLTRETATTSTSLSEQPDQLVFSLFIKSKQHSETGLCFDLLKPDEKGNVVGFSGSAGQSLVKFSLNIFSGLSQIEKEEKLTKAGVSDIKIRTDGKIFISAGWDLRVRVFSVKKMQPLAILKYHQQHINSLAFSPSDFLFASGGQEGRIPLWNLYSQE
eukprot:TRINITY_DN224_c0_g1_i1.p1 TRINITY_DN224_c0_g1~~TRINITY_DN224_c0_g1_i1.p1  ORF type:complete len:211 (+),score=45.77 TRINITY_DN224_c0_g1_i1:587-1219(+)